MTVHERLDMVHATVEMVRFHVTQWVAEGGLFGDYDLPDSVVPLLNAIKEELEMIRHVVGDRHGP